MAKDDGLVMKFTPPAARYGKRQQVLRACYYDELLEWATLPLAQHYKIYDQAHNKWRL
jgi:hypothetical protein